MTDTSTRPFRLLIGGDAVEPGDGTYDIVNPATEQVVGEAPERLGRADAEAACAAAKAAFAGLVAHLARGALGAAR